MRQKKSPTGRPGCFLSGDVPICNANKIAPALSSPQALPSLPPWLLALPGVAGPPWLLGLAGLVALAVLVARPWLLALARLVRLQAPRSAARLRDFGWAGTTDTHT